MNTPTPEAVAAAASAIVDAFAATDTDRYFGGFAPDATFVFHTEPARLDDRAAYERLWAQWLSEGWRVTSCTSTDRRVQVFPGGAVFTHTVETSVETADGPESYRGARDHRVRRRRRAPPRGARAPLAAFLTRHPPPEPTKEPEDVALHPSREASGGAVRRRRSRARHVLHRPDADDLACRQPRRHDAADRNTVRARRSVRPRARPDRRRHGRRCGGARARRRDRHPHRPSRRWR